jgi:hypothetical protein
MTGEFPKSILRDRPGSLRSEPIAS